MNPIRNRLGVLGAALIIAALGWLGLGATGALAATSNGQQIRPCPACEQKNAQGGNGSGFFFPGTVCVDGDFGHVVNAVNREKDTVTVNILPYQDFPLAAGQKASRTVFAPPGSGETITTLYVKMVDVKTGKVIIGGDGPGGTKPVVLPCPPCTPDATTTTVVTPTTSTAVTTTTTATTVPSSSTTPTTGQTTTTLHGNLPETGAPTGLVVGTGSAALAAGLGLLLIGRRRGSES